MLTGHTINKSNNFNKYSFTKLTTLCFLLLSAFIVSACSSNKSADAINSSANSQSNLEQFNRSATKLNLTLDKNFIRPGASLINRYAPPFIYEAAANARINFLRPISISYALAIGNPKYAASQLGGLTLDALFGLGLINWSETVGIPQTSIYLDSLLYRYGVPEGKYLQLPGFGPRTQLTASNIVTTGYIEKLFYGNSLLKISPYVVFLNLLNLRISFLNKDELIYQSIDSYEVLKSLYLQNLQYQRKLLLNIPDEIAVPGNDINLDDL